MEWDAPGIILDTRPFGETDVLATIMTEDHGAHRGLARGGQSRSRAALWQPGNLVQARWTARLSDNLGSFTAELIHPAAALVLDDPLALAMLRSACATAEGALQEREAYPRSFDGLLRLLARLPQGAPLLTDLVLWELTLLADLGYGLDLTRCAVSGATDRLAFVSPRSGRAVAAEAAGALLHREGVGVAVRLLLPFGSGGRAPCSGPRPRRRGAVVGGPFKPRGGARRSRRGCSGFPRRRSAA